jgi:hypothetical protein
MSNNNKTLTLFFISLSWSNRLENGSSLSHKKTYLEIRSLTSKTLLNQSLKKSLISPILTIPFPTSSDTLNSTTPIFSKPFSKIYFLKFVKTIKATLSLSSFYTNFFCMLKSKTLKISLSKNFGIFGLKI